MGISKKQYKEIFDAMAPTLEEFEVRLYKWALLDAKREVDENFSLLRRARSELTTEFLHFAEPLSAEDRLSLLYAHVKHRHEKAVRLTGHTLSPREENLYNEKKLARRFGVSKDSRAFRHQDRTQVAKKMLRMVLMDKLKDGSLGEYDPWDPSDSNEWRYRHKVGHWIVETYIDVGGAIHQLSYSHAVKSPEDVTFIMHGLASWFGGVGNHYWNMLTNENLSEAIDDLRLICQHFLNAVPSLLAGLEPPTLIT
jgi:hypothetical protein